MTETKRARKEDKVERGRAQDAQKTRKKKENKQRKDRLKKGIRPPCYLPLWLFLDSRCVAVALPPRVNPFSFLGCLSGSAAVFVELFVPFFSAYSLVSKTSAVEMETRRNDERTFFLLFFCPLVCLLLKEKEQKEENVIIQTDNEQRAGSIQEKYRSRQTEMQGTEG